MNVEKKINDIIDWLKKVKKDTNVNGMLVGISGGIDSAVVAYLIKRAFPNNSMGVILPIKNTEKDLSDANELIKMLNIDNTIIDLTILHKNLLDNIKTEFKKYNYKFDKITDANLRARLRMSTLYAIANNINYLVVGTDNAAEIFTGYFTKYGDGGVDILPIANLLKEEVYEIAKFAGIPSSIIEKAPSAGLWEGQTDENEMGTKYKYIDKFLKGEEIPQEDKKIIVNLNKKTEHKRNTPLKPPF